MRPYSRPSIPLFLDYYVLNTKAANFSETSVTVHQSTRSNTLFLNLHEQHFDNKYFIVQLKHTNCKTLDY